MGMKEHLCSLPGRQLVSVSASGHVIGVTQHKAGPPGARHANHDALFSIPGMNRGASEPKQRHKTRVSVSC